MFRRPTIADIYVKELATVDRRTVAFFPPNAGEVVLGTIGRFKDGEWERRDHLDSRLGGRNGFAAAFPATDPTDPGTFVFHSDGKVELGPSITGSVAGKDVLKASLKLSRDRAVVASFDCVTGIEVRNVSELDDQLRRLYYDGKLHSDEVVVWRIERAATGTVIVNRKGGITLDITADPSIVGTEISWGSLGLGVSFSGSSSASAQVSGTDYIVGVGLKRLSPGDVIEIDNVRGFDAGPEVALEQFRGVPVPSLSAADLVADADFSRPED